MLALSTVLLARILGAAGFGIYAFVFSTVYVFSNLAAGSLGLTGTRYLAQVNSADPARTLALIRFFRNVTWLVASTLALGIFIGADAIGAWFLPPGSAQFLRWGSLTVLFSILFVTEAGFLMGLEAFRQLAKVQVLRGVLTLACPILLGRTHGIAGAMAGLGLASTVSYIWALSATRAAQPEVHSSNQRGGAFREFAMLWEFSLPAGLASLLLGPTIWLAQAILVTGPDGVRQLAVFQVAMTLRNMAVFVPSQIGAAIVPALSRLLGRMEGRERLTHILSYTTVASLLTVLPIAAYIGLYSRHVASLFGPEFGDASGPLQLAAVTAVVISVTVPMGNVLTALGAMWLGFTLNVVWAAIALSTTAWLTASGMGARGTHAAFLVAYVVHSLTTALVAMKHIRKPGVERRRV